MRFSEHFKLGRSQSELDFVDIDVEGDIPLFLDPRALYLLQGEWASECVSLLQSFFGAVLDAIKTGDETLARGLLQMLREPNETHLGLSREKAQGRAVGSELARDVWTALSTSEAAKTGLLEDLEDTILMVEGVAADIVSDMATNIVRMPLITYTQSECGYFEVPLEKVDSGPLWNPATGRWQNAYVDLPTVGKKKIILVPKAIVRHHLDYDVSEYYHHYILEHLRDIELDLPNSDLVRLLKGGRRTVTKKALAEKYGGGKAMIVRVTREHPEILAKYRADKSHNISSPLPHISLAEAIEGTSMPPDWSDLVAGVLAVPTGRESADAYEKAIETLLSALFYPDLVHPVRQTQIHNGRKRIDITYTNAAQKGFFWWIGQHYPAPKVMIECKNYESDPANPELDQLGGRFSPTRGKVGILVCRTLGNKELFITRCRDTSSDDRGFIIPLDDDDLRALVEEQDKLPEDRFALLRSRFDRLIL